MTTDTKELLTYAAKVAGFEYRSIGNKIFFERDGYLMGVWNPATDDGDSARLRTALLVHVLFSPDSVSVFNHVLEREEAYADHSGDKNAALRMATLRLAAEIWRAKEGAQRD